MRVPLISKNTKETLEIIKLNAPYLFPDWPMYFGERSIFEFLFVEYEAAKECIHEILKHCSKYLCQSKESESVSFTCFSHSAHLFVMHLHFWCLKLLDCEPLDLYLDTCSLICVSCNYKKRPKLLNEVLSKLVLKKSFKTIREISKSVDITLNLEPIFNELCSSIPDSLPALECYLQFKLKNIDLFLEYPSLCEAMLSNNNLEESDYLLLLRSDFKESICRGLCSRTLFFEPELTANIIFSMWSDESLRILCCRCFGYLYMNLSSNYLEIMAKMCIFMFPDAVAVWSLANICQLYNGLFIDDFLKLPKSCRVNAVRALGSMYSNYILSFGCFREDVEDFLIQSLIRNFSDKTKWNACCAAGRVLEVAERPLICEALIFVLEHSNNLKVKIHACNALRNCKNKTIALRILSITEKMPLSVFNAAKEILK